MLNEEQEKRLRAAVSGALGVDPSEIPEDASSLTMAEWTSLNHLSVMAAVEETFAATFTMDEIGSAQSLVEIRRLLTHA